MFRELLRVLRLLKEQSAAMADGSSSDDASDAGAPDAPGASDCALDGDGDDPSQGAGNATYLQTYL